jgi:DNA ligase-1
MISKTWPCLYKRAVNGKISQWQVEVENNCYRTTSGYTDGVQTTSEWTCCKPKNVGKKNSTTAEQQAEAEAEAMWQKRIELGSFEDIKKIDTPSYFKPMLAHRWEDYEKNVIYPIYSQPKLDGVRCIVNKDGMWSRNGKPIISAPHVFEELKDLLEENPYLVFDGELYCDKLANDFNKIISLVKKTKPTEEDLIESANIIQYHIYDLPESLEDIVSGFGIRLDELKSILKPIRSGGSKIIQIVKTDIVNNDEEVMKKYEEYVDQGYEGQMLRLNTFYEHKRSKALLKHKSFIDEEYTITGVFEGEGNRTGMIGYMTFETKNGKSFKSNVKADWDALKQLWKIKDTLIGKSATVKYFNLTPDGVPRFPYVINIDRESYE